MDSFNLLIVFVIASTLPISAAGSSSSAWRGQDKARAAGSAR